MTSTQTSALRGGVASGALLLADISGYTEFLDAVTTAHHDDLFGGSAVPAAYPLISTLLDGIIERLSPPFTLAKLEGDAVFAFATLDALPSGVAILGCMSDCYAAFRAQLAHAGDLWSCRCDACVRVADLDLKFVLHAGSFVMQAIAGSRELAGPDVVAVHRLLKNRAVEVLGTRAYALVTVAASQRLGIPEAGSTRLTEALDGGRTLEAMAFRLA